MIGHHEFKEGFTCAQNFLGIGDDFHAWLDRPDAGGGENARAGVHHAEAADADGCLILQMAKYGMLMPFMPRRRKRSCQREHGRVGRRE